MATRQYTNPRARRFERIIRRATTAARPITLRAVACLAHDYSLTATEARAAAALRFLGESAHV